MDSPSSFQNSSTNERIAAVASALASQRMEGLEPDRSTQEDAALWASGNITILEAISKLRSRLVTPKA